MFLFFAYLLVKVLYIVNAVMLIFVLNAFLGKLGCLNAPPPTLIYIEQLD